MRFLLVVVMLFKGSGFGGFPPNNCTRVVAVHTGSGGVDAFLAGSSYVI
jgi:hypothetical protein